MVLQEIEPPEALVSVILARVAHVRRNAARLRLATFGALALVSVAALVPAVQYAVSEFQTSGFYEYAALFFDSFSQGYWGEIFYSLANSLPSFALLLLLATGAVLLWSVWRVNRDARIAFTRRALPA